jgi:5-methylcytosine-specific restriction endonuclease McrA
VEFLNTVLFDCAIPEAELAREKAKAREMRQSQWWKRRRSSGVCHYCGEQFPPRELTMDHVVPLVRGGKSTRTNVVPCCRPCNAAKKYLLPVEWEEYLNQLSGSPQD